MRLPRIRVPSGSWDVATGPEYEQEYEYEHQVGSEAGELA
jgi:hypothetical protein